MQHTFFPLFLFLIASLAWQPQADACIHLPPSYKQSISQKAQEALILHADGIEQLILKINMRLPDASESKAKKLDKLAWIVPVPNKPLSYKVANKKLFNELYQWRQRYNLRETRKSIGRERGAKFAKKTKRLVFDKQVKVGAYTIQPIRGTSENDTGALNNWLKTNGFAPVAPKQLHYFLQNKFTFLCIKVDFKPEDKDYQPRPLRITFPSKKVYYPLRFSSHQGNFFLYLTLLTQQPLDYIASAKALSQITYLEPKSQVETLFAPYGWQKNAKAASLQFYPTMKPLLEGKFKKDIWYFNYIEVPFFDAKKEIPKWNSDIFFTLGKSKGQQLLEQKIATIRKGLHNKRLFFWKKYRNWNDYAKANAKQLKQAAAKLLAMAPKTSAAPKKTSAKTSTKARKKAAPKTTKTIPRSSK